MTAVETLRARFLAGETRALARGLSWVEAGDPRGAALRAALRRRPATARLIGLTGAPGVGKSTLADRLIGTWRDRGQRVAVLAFDPSSPYSGGALLGDRVRMTRWAGDEGVFVRSMATRGRTGGLAPAAHEALALLVAFGFDVVLLETVGVGQAEVDVAAVADTTVVALAPGLGDDVQAAKAGLMEVADVYVVTKADRPHAGRLAREVRDAVALLDAIGAPRRGAGAPRWRPPVVLVAAGAAAADLPAGFAADGGLGELLAALDGHAAHLAATGAATGREAERVRAEVVARAQASLRAEVADLAADDWGAVAGGERSAEGLAAELLARAARRAAAAPRPPAGGGGVRGRAARGDAPDPAGC